MKSFKDTVVLLTIVFSALFLLNTGLMYACFGINALNPIRRGEETGRTVEAGIRPGTVNAYGDPDESRPAGAGTAENSGEDPGETAASGETGILPAVSGMYMTAEEVRYLGELSLQDKLSALMLVSEVGSPDSDRIYELASDGVTYAELEEIRGILEKKLSKADMDVLYDILDKSRRLYAERLAKQ